MARSIPVSWVQLFCFFSILCRGVFSEDHTPMLLWSTDGSLQGLASTLHEGGIISTHKLHKFLQHTTSSGSRNLVVFLQDTLSVDDFTRYADPAGSETPFLNVQLTDMADSYNSYKITGDKCETDEIYNLSQVYHTALKRLLKTASSSLVLPAVDCQAVTNLTEYLQKTLNLPLMNVDGPETSNLMVNASKPSLFVIRLQPTRRKDEPSIIKALMENDKIIGRFSTALQQQGVPSLMIYTARQPSRVPVQFHVAGHSRRQLMSAEAQDNQLYAPVYALNGSHPCILFYATNFSLIVAKTRQLIPLANLTFGSHKVNTSSSWCLSTNAMLSLQYTEPVSWMKSLEIRFMMTNKHYEGSARNWFTLDSVEIEEANGSVATFNVSMISSPVEYSFHCQLVETSSQHGVALIPWNDEAKRWEVIISDFQIQAFSVQNTTFSYASDCTSFFTPAIWMALVTSLVLLLILTYGIHMIVNLTTNNRFDDPKGPRLSVPETE